ncbi:peptidoglycan amidohydrolase family protein [Eupransor demetentiae]|uniref:NlpC_P60 family (NlpC) n=1 Tax=Eupransor demetentiae TaxID=3109584 RepID=A0ABM9N4K5_9LACO|nr:Cell wall-associated hydrolase [Lactobacillaceae bacterium LMG 33000]
MAYNAQVAVNTARSFVGGVTYSMDWDKRDGLEANGTQYFDCSGFVYFILNAAGAIDQSYLERSHYTGTLKQDLEAAGFKEVQKNADGSVDAQAGDIYIWGTDYGKAAGGACHTGIMTGNDTEISSCFYYLGAPNTAVVELDYDMYLGLDGNPEWHIFRYMGGGSEITPSRPLQPKPNGAIEKFKALGGEFLLGGQLTVQAVETHHVIVQARIDELTAEPFNWDDNGIPLDVLYNDEAKTNDIVAGSKVRFKQSYNNGVIDEYDVKDNAVGIDFTDGNGVVWFDADKFYNHP